MSESVIVVVAADAAVVELSWVEFVIVIFSGPSANVPFLVVHE